MDAKSIASKIEEYEEKYLNPDQLRAVELLQMHSDQPDAFLLPIVDGPPGTGKTTAAAVGVAKKLVELHQRRMEGRFIVLCYTHVASMRAKEKLEDLRLHENEAVHLTPYPSETNFERGIVGCSSDLSNLEIGVQRWLRTRPTLVTTLLGVSRAISAFGGRRCHLLIDEFSQVNAADFFACTSQVRGLKPYSLSLFGDPLQLPVVTSQTHLRPNICSFINPRSRGTKTVNLTIQYRMHEHICEAINEMRGIFRTFPIRSANWVRDRTLTGLKYEWDPMGLGQGLRKTLDPQNPLVLVDTSELGIEESRGRIIRFKEEAELAVRIATAASKSYKDQKGNPLRPTILTPYKAQRGTILEKLPSGRGECATIYKSQGNEFPMVIISFVRNNEDRFIGFLDDGQLVEQVYVGCSRAMGKLVVLLSFDTFFGGHHRMFQALERSPHAIPIEASEVMR